MIMSWCKENRHQMCHRRYQVFQVDPKSNKVIYTDVWRVCECPKRGCACYVPAKDRTKSKKARRKK